MIDPIRSSGVQVTKIATPSAAPVKAPDQFTTTPVRADVPTGDTVQLSYAAQALALRQQGLSIPEIAMQLKLDIKTVTSYFPESAPPA